MLLPLENPTVEVASHVLQFLYLGNEGFRFPFAYYPTCEASPADLYHKFWEAAMILEANGFNVIYGCFDGGENNRSFVKMQIPDPWACCFTAYSLSSGEPFVFLMDSSVSES